MKKTFIMTLIILASLLLIPLFTTTDKTPTVSTLPTLSPQKTETATETVKILVSETEKIEEITVTDYLFGVVAGEMPALYEAEALKAQAVASYTFLKWRKTENAEKDYDITDDFKTDQCYITDDAARKKWGDNYDEYKKKITSAINEVVNQTITYEGETILSVYHSISSGKTENAKDVWGKDYPYLQAVDSSADKDSEHCISSKTLTQKELSTALSLQSLPKDTNKIFTNITRTKSGAVKTLKIGETEYTGSQIRSLLELKSANFKIDFENDKYIFTVYGYGHGVGMSQNGANELAKQGKTYQEILKHYYKGCEIMLNEE